MHVVRNQLGLRCKPPALCAQLRLLGQLSLPIIFSTYPLHPWPCPASSACSPFWSRRPSTRASGPRCSRARSCRCVLQSCEPCFGEQFLGQLSWASVPRCSGARTCKCVLFKIRSQACATRNGAAAPAQPPSAGNQLPVTPASLLLCCRRPPLRATRSGCRPT